MVPPFRGSLQSYHGAVDVLYSWTLLLALAGGGASAAAGLAALLTRRRSPTAPAEGLAGGGRGPRLTRIAVRLAAFSFAALVISVTVHVGWGHRPGSPEALSPVEFLRIHPSFVVAGALAGGGLLASLAHMRNRGRSGGDSERDAP